MEILNTILGGYLAKSYWELLAVALGVAYLLLAMRQSLWCWPSALLSTAIYTLLFWDVALLMDSALNFYYMLMAVYGWWLWTKPRSTSDENAIAIHRWPWRTHAVLVLVVVCLSGLSGVLLQRYTQAAWPYLDSFTTWGSVVTTYMVAKKVLENWWYWIVIDSIALALYIERGLYPTAALFALYLVMCVWGLWVWKREYLNELSDDNREKSTPSFAT